MSKGHCVTCVCERCRSPTEHVYVHSVFTRRLMHWGKIAVFLVTMGMVYPSVFAPDGDDAEAECSKCHARATVPYG